MPAAIDAESKVLRQVGDLVNERQMAGSICRASPTITHTPAPILLRCLQLTLTPTPNANEETTTYTSKLMQSVSTTQSAFRLQSSPCDIPFCKPNSVPTALRRTFSYPRMDACSDQICKSMRITCRGIVIISLRKKSDSNLSQVV